MNGRTIKIGSLLFSIAEEEKLTGEFGEDLLGRYSIEYERIQLQQGLPPRVKRAILMHEIVHGIFENTGHEQDEAITNAVAYGICQVLLENPWIAALFLEEQIGKLQEAIKKATPLHEAWTMLFGQNV